MEEIVKKYGLQPIMHPDEDYEDMTTHPGELLDYGPEDFKDERKQRIFVMEFLVACVINAERFGPEEYKNRLAHEYSKIIERVVTGITTDQVTCPLCGGSGQQDDYYTCPECCGEGTVKRE